MAIGFCQANSVYLEANEREAKASSLTTVISEYQFQRLQYDLSKCVMNTFRSPPKLSLPVEIKPTNDEIMALYFDFAVINCGASERLLKPKLLDTSTATQIKYSYINPNDQKNYLSFVGFDIEAIKASLEFSNEVPEVIQTPESYFFKETKNPKVCRIGKIEQDESGNSFVDDKNLRMILGFKYLNGNNSCERICAPGEFMKVRNRIGVGAIDSTRSLIDIGIGNVDLADFTVTRPNLFEYQCKSCAQEFGPSYSMTKEYDNSCYSSKGCPQSQEWLDSESICVDRCTPFQTRNPKSGRCEIDRSKICQDIQEQLHIINSWNYRSRMAGVYLPKCSNETIMTAAQAYKLDEDARLREYKTEFCDSQNVPIEELHWVPRTRFLDFLINGPESETYDYFGKFCENPFLEEVEDLDLERFLNQNSPKLINEIFFAPYYE